MGKYLKCVLFIYSLGLSQPSDEHKTFMKGSEEPSTSVHVREQQEMGKVLTGLLTLPSEPCEYAPSCGLAKALAESCGQRGTAIPLGMYLQHRIRSQAPLCWWAPRPAGAGWLPPWSRPPSRCRWWKGLCLLLAAVHTCSSQWEKRERERGDKEKEERRKKQSHNQPWVTFARQICCKKKYWQILQKWPQRVKEIVLQCPFQWPWKGTRKQTFVGF